MSDDLEARTLGFHSSESGRHARLVERVVLHGRPRAFADLIPELVPTDARFVVLDFDRTVHLGRNLGELLGWELGAHLAYGEAERQAMEPRRKRGRFALDRHNPRGVLRYVVLGVRMWADAGLYYLLWGKLPGVSRALHKLRFRRFGLEPVRAVQAVPQTALLHHLAGVPLALLRRLASDVWARHEPDQVITASDIAAIRARAPLAHIILASASPEPMVALAAERLGVDEVHCTTLDRAGEQLASPVRWFRRFGRPSGPVQFSVPSRHGINSSRAKVERLVAAHPEILAPGTVTVGISDTGYGEDHCWADFFTHVVDLNSDAPFPPFVAAGSPLREVHSAFAFSRDELLRREQDPTYLDPRRDPLPSGVDLTFERDQLAHLLGSDADAIERLAARFQAGVGALEAARRSVVARYQAVQQRLDDLVLLYNQATDDERPSLLTQLDRLLEQVAERTHLLGQVERPLADLAHGLQQLREHAQQKLLGEAQRRTGVGAGPDMLDTAR
ncbi:MAG: hypothetical protein IPN77_27175 [Sandaracinaceae bacterium]|nr:hypothetical protein [Sandaracinaceae bacterium]